MEYYGGEKWISLTEQTGGFLAPKTLRNKFGRVNAMKHFLGIDKTCPVLERSFEAATKLTRELSTDKDRMYTIYGTFIFS